MAIMEAADNGCGGQGESVISEVYLGTLGSLRKFIAKMGANAADVEDIAQEALVRTMKADGDRMIENPKAYLFRVAQNLALRQRRPRGYGIMQDMEDDDMAGIAADLPSVEEQVISRERLALLMDAVAALPPVCRRVVVMRKVYGYSHQEVAERLGIAVSTVEKHLVKGFGRCVEAMRRHEEEDEAFDPMAVAAE